MRIFLFALTFLSLHIGFSQTTVADSTAKAEIDRLYNMVMEGKSFSLVAKIYSEDQASASRGGLYDWTERGTFDVAFEAIVYKLTINEISKPFKTQYGYHIVQVVEREENRIMLRQIMIVPKIER